MPTSPKEGRCPFHLDPKPPFVVPQRTSVDPPPNGRSSVGSAVRQSRPKSLVRSFSCCSRYVLHSRACCMSPLTPAKWEAEASCKMRIGYPLFSAAGQVIVLVGPPRGTRHAHATTRIRKPALESETHRAKYLH